MYIFENVGKINKAATHRRGKLKLYTRKEE